MHTRFFGLALIVAQLACRTSDDEMSAESSGDAGAPQTTRSSGSDPASTTMPATESGGPTTTTTTTSGTLDTGSGPGNATTGVQATSTTDPKTGSETTSTAPPSDCELGCEVEFACGGCATAWKSAEACTSWCEDNIVKATNFNDFCGIAWSDLSRCLSGLTCDDFVAWCAQDPPDAYPCSIEDFSLAADCAGQF